MGFRVLGMPWGIMGGSLGTRIGGSKGGGIPLVYLLNDEFTTPEAAPVTSPRTCEPGPGTIVIKDSGNDVSIAAGALTMSSITASNDPEFHSSVTHARAAGVAAFFKHTISVKSYHGFDNTAGTDATPDEVLYFNNTVLEVRVPTVTANLGAIVAGTEYQSAVILRTTGIFFLIKGGIYTNWTLLWVDNTATRANQYMVWNQISGAPNTHSVDHARVAQLPAPWATDNGIATEVLAGARAPGDTFSHTADCLIEMEVVTLPGGGQIELWFRIQDATNYWAVTVNAAGDLELDEVVAGVTTQRGSAAGVVANSDRIMVIAYGETIDVFEATTRRIHYTAAANFKTETNGELDTEGAAGAVADIISWPRNPSETILDAYADGN